MSISQKNTSQTISKTTSPQSISVAIPINLPLRRAQLFGRSKESQSLRRIILQDDSSLVTLIGPGGTGKTTLALHVAENLIDSFQGGVYFVNLTLVSDPNLTSSHIVQTLKISNTKNSFDLELIIDFIGRQSILLILDNFEHLLDASLLVAKLLDACPNLKIICTSREPLQIYNEKSFPVHPLEPDAAVELFKYRALAVKPNLNLDDESIKAVSKLCEEIDRLPLAIELAAQQVSVFSPTQLFARFHAGLKTDTVILDYLASGPRDVHARHQTLRDTIAWGYSLLNENEQQVFRCLSMFRGHFSSEETSQILDWTEEQVLPVFSSLLRKNLIAKNEEETSPPYFYLLQTLREFAREQVGVKGEEQILTSAYIKAFVDFSKRSDLALKSNGYSKWFARLDVHRPNLINALDLAFNSTSGSESWFDGFAILEHLNTYFILSGNVNFSRKWIELGTRLIEDYAENHTDQKVFSGKVLHIKGVMYSMSGSLAWAIGDYKKACDFHELAYKTYKQLDDEKAMSSALNDWAVNLALLGKNDLAVKKHKQGIALARKIRDPWEEIRHLNNYGGNLLYIKEKKEAMLTFLYGIELSRKLGNTFFLAAFKLNIGYLHLYDDAHNDAFINFQDALKICGEMENPYILAWALIGLSMVYLTERQLTSAVEILKKIHSAYENYFDADLKRTALTAFTLAYSSSLQTTPQAALLMGSLKAFLDQSQTQPSPYELAYIKKIEENIRLSLKSGKYNQLLRQGGGMTVAQALETSFNELDLIKVKPLPESGKNPLTEREHDVLMLLGRGLSNEGIARELFVSLKTVEKHTASIYRKTGARNRTEAVSWAVKNGFFPFGDAQ